MNSIHTSRAIPKMRLLLLDEQGSKIEACIKGVAMQKFDNIIKEGDCYVISNCRLARNVGWTRLSDNKFKLNFICSTNIESILSTTLAEYRYDFVPFEAVDGRGNKNCYVIGVSGRMSTMSINIVLKDENSMAANGSSTNQDVARTQTPLSSSLLVDHDLLARFECLSSEESLACYHSLDQRRPRRHQNGQIHQVNYGEVVLSGLWVVEVGI
ncbi:hypothetical protein ACFE04_026827 [Oxalis oulophora]